MWHTSDEAPANNQLKLKRANTHITYMAIENIKHLENKIVCKWQIKIVQYKKKSCIRETKHLSTDADSSTDTTVGWTKNTRKPNFFKNGKIIQNAKT